MVDLQASQPLSQQRRHRQPGSAVSRTESADLVGSPETIESDGPGPTFVAVPALSGTSRVRRAATGPDPLGGSKAAPELVSTLDRMRGRGARLDESLAGPFGQALDTDLAGVTVHTDPAAHALTRSLQATAFTHGSDIYFSAGSYAPATSTGRHLLAHELAHVAQERVGASGPGTVIGRADDPAEVQAEATADRISRLYVGGDAPAGLPTPTQGPGAATPQRLSRSSIARMIRRAGDKLAFDAKQVDEAADRDLVTTITAAIAAHQQTKRDYKNSIETAKDNAIDKHEADFQQKLVDAKVADIADPDARQKATSKLAAPTRNRKVAELKDYHEQYKKSGWNLNKLSAEILAATEHKVDIGREVDGEIAITSKATGATLYSIFKGAKRFGAAETKDAGAELTNPSHTKKGTTKQYVQDRRGLFIGRFVFRGCSPEQMKQMFADGTMLPRNNTDEIGEQITKFDFGAAKVKTDAITEEQREFLQQRDGSGKQQRMLSVTHAKAHRKVHSNHGEEFRGVEDTSAVIKIDLSRVPKDLIADVHLEESHQFKVGLPQKGRSENKAYAERAEKEKGLYIYSAERNRETLIRSIPETAVVSVKVKNVADAMTMYTAKRFYNVEFNRQEVEREAKEQEEKLKAASTTPVSSGDSKSTGD